MVHPERAEPVVPILQPECAHVPTCSVNSPCPDSANEAALTLVRGIPKDQALGLRLIAFARAAAAIHVADSTSPARLESDPAQFSRTQAASLARQVRP